ncbi:helix-turn-helix protein [Sphingobacterium allocomposti]|uniref:Helix-turn-helix protein n=1 Tax=Sphingobacterium allocomposti TaxID=415956 RepID=A0A5S5DCI3_9SPHI|nr:helix-turn-helix transcriptional regulator [Sphingobacterium composti Yoo et al. 2007 non Ten et al. 2007]TYP92412.1 helix-turn-helix protein [Sphingobacterium composti Yoo et al. 2007 non Ten et al. 2007]
MVFKIVYPTKNLSSSIHNYWELRGEEHDNCSDRIFPDGCSGLVLNMGNVCLTDSGRSSLLPGTTSVVGPMTTYKESLIRADTHLIGVCFKPGAFANFYDFVAQDQLLNETVQLDRKDSFDVGKFLVEGWHYFNRFFSARLNIRNGLVLDVIEDIHSTCGILRLAQIVDRNHVTMRTLERLFKKHIGLTPKEYSRIIRLQRSMTMIKNNVGHKTLSDIAFECGYYDHAHLTNEIREFTGLAPSML